MIESYEALYLFLPTRQVFPFGIRPLSGAARVSVTLSGLAISFAHQLIAIYTGALEKLVRRL